MKTSFKNYEELAHYWANNDCGHSGKTYCGRMFFYRDKIYSYGYHYVIAQKVRDKKGNVVFVAFNAETNSMTTNKHRYIVRRALHQLVFSLPEANPYRPDVIADYFIKGAKENLIASGRGRIANREAYKARAAANIADWHTYAALMKKAGAKPYKLLKSQKLVLGTGGDVDLDKVREAEEQAIKKAIADKKKRAKLLHAQELQIVSDWKNGKRDELPYLQTIEDTYLRISDGQVQTSRNAAVSAESAKILWKMIEAGSDVKGHAIDGYTVISMNGVLKVGCHVIDRSEVERIGQLLNEISM